MVAEPVAIAVARPPALIVTTVASDEVQVITRPASTLLFASDVVAENCCVAPTTIDGAAGATTTLATGTGVTVIVCVPVFPPACALITDCPAAMPVIIPVDEIVAIVVALDDHVTEPIEMAAPF
jgi:hypothetical protein